MSYAKDNRTLLPLTVGIPVFCEPMKS